VQAPSRDPGDLGMAHTAETALIMPSTPKRLSHMALFWLLEVGFIGGVVGIGIPFHFDVSVDGGVSGVEKPNPAGLSLVVPRFTEEQPVPTATLSKVLLFAPARRLLRCLRRAHRHRLKKISWSTRAKMRLLTTCRW